MAEVDISVNGRDYKVSCDDGQEERLKQLAQYFDGHVSTIAKDLGQIGDARLMLLSALTLCDELFDAQKRINSLENATESLDSETAGGAARVIEAAARRIDMIAEKLDKQKNA